MIRHQPGRQQRHHGLAITCVSGLDSYLGAFRNQGGIVRVRISDSAEGTFGCGLVIRRRYERAAECDRGESEGDRKNEELLYCYFSAPHG
jgi:hypothetical protein